MIFFDAGRRQQKWGFHLNHFPAMKKLPQDDMKVDVPDELVKEMEAFHDEKKPEVMAPISAEDELKHFNDIAKIYNRIPPDAAFRIHKMVEIQLPRLFRPQEDQGSKRRWSSSKDAGFVRSGKGQRTASAQRVRPRTRCPRRALGPPLSSTVGGLHKTRKQTFMNSTTEPPKTIAQAILEAQRKIGAAVKGAKNPFYDSKYADLGSVMETVKRPCNEAGITILQPVGYEKDANGIVTEYVETILIHESDRSFISA